MRSQPLAITLVAALVLSTAACSPTGDDQSAGILAPAGGSFLVGDRNDSYTVRLGLVNVCAFYPAGSTPFSSTFSASASGGTVLAGNFSISDPPPLCMEVWNATGSSAVAVASTLVSNSPGYALDRIVTSVGNLVDDATFVTHTGV